MAATLPAEVLQDEIAVSLARVITAGNKHALELGVGVVESLITVTQQFADGRSLWRINYGPKNYVGRRGGDLIIEVDSSDASIKKVLRGQ